MKSVLIVGGGVIGLCTAHYLLQRGCRVAIAERGAPAHDSCSLGNAGMIVPSHFVPLAAPGMIGLGLRMLPNPEGPFAIRPSADPGLIDWCLKFAQACTAGRAARAAPILRDLNLASRRCYEELAELPGAGFGLCKRGLLMLCRLPETLRAETAVAESARMLGLQAEALGPEAAAKLDPGIDMAVAGAVYFPEDCHLDPGHLIAWLTQRLEADGVRFHWNTEVTGAAMSGTAVEALETSAGRLEADEIVLAGGAWSAELARTLGLRLPMQSGKGYSLTLERPAQLPRLCSILMEARVAVTPMDNKLRFAGTMEITGLDPSINHRRVAGITSAVPAYFPKFQQADFASVPVWSGLRPCSPDGMPYVGRSRRFTNLSVATGHAMMGISLGPVTGKIIADILCGIPMGIDISLLDPDRYA